MGLFDFFRRKPAQSTNKLVPPSPAPPAPPRPATVAVVKAHHPTTKLKPLVTKPTKKVRDKKALDKSRFGSFRGTGTREEVYDSLLNVWYPIMDLVETVSGPSYSYYSDSAPASSHDSSPSHSYSDHGSSHSSHSSHSDSGGSSYSDSGYSSSDSGGSSDGGGCGGGCD